MFIDNVSLLHGALGICILLVIQLLQKRQPLHVSINRWPFAAQCILYAVVIFTIILFGVDGRSQFIYFQF